MKTYLTILACVLVCATLFFLPEEGSSASAYAVSILACAGVVAVAVRLFKAAGKWEDR